MYVYMYTCMYVYVNIYVYIYVELNRESYIRQIQYHLIVSTKIVQF